MSRYSRSGTFSPSIPSRGQAERYPSTSGTSFRGSFTTSGDSYGEGLGSDQFSNDGNTNIGTESEIDEDEEHRLVLALDFGTTYTGIAMAKMQGSHIQLDKIKVNMVYPGPGTNTDKVPSVISYTEPSNKAEKQWGSDLSDNAVVMINQKLELEVRSLSEELDLIISTLDRVHDLNFGHVKKSPPSPEYTTKGPDLIVLDYLRKVFNHVLPEIDKFVGRSQMRDILPVDIVATIPAVSEEVCPLI
jgi:hypothetical protein